MDTFIADAQVWSDLRTLTDQIASEKRPIERLDLRVERAEIFFNYAQREYLKLRNEALRRGLASQWCSEPFASMRTQLNQALARAKASAVRNYGNSTART